MRRRNTGKNARDRPKLGGKGMGTVTTEGKGMKRKLTLVRGKWEGQGKEEKGARAANQV